MGASLVIGVDGDEHRLTVAKEMGADITLNRHQCDVVSEIERMTGGGADVAIEALGVQETFENCLRCLRPGGILSSLGCLFGQTAGAV